MSHLTESSDQHPDVVVLKFDPPQRMVNSWAFYDSYVYLPKLINWSN
mgnify:CR=1 FL=1